MTWLELDKLWEFKYDNSDSPYNYKGVVGVPALEMVNDINDIKYCGVTAVTSNVLIISFKEHKKLEMGQEKFYRIHCDKKSISCLDLKVQMNSHSLEYNLHFLLHSQH